MSDLNDQNPPKSHYVFLVLFPRNRPRLVRLNIRISLIAVTLTALTGCAGFPEPRQAPRSEGLPIDFAPPDPPTERYLVRKGDLTESYLFNGVLEPKQRTPVTTPITGRLSVTPPAEGTEVEKGDLLFALSPTDEVKRAALELEAARLSITVFGFSPQRAQRVAEAEFHAASLGLPTDWRASRALPAFFEVKAPQDGIVVSRRRVSEAIPAGTPIVEIASPSDLVIKAKVETDIAEFLGVNTELTLNKKGSSTAPIMGRIASIGLGDRASEVWLTITPDGGLFRIGDEVLISFDATTKENVLWVPKDAVQFFGADHYLLIETSETIRRVVIEKGLETVDGIEVIGAVTAGEIGVIP